MIMRIAIIGKGNVGRTLGTNWASHGHEVMYGVRDVSKEEDSAKNLAVKEAAQASEVVVLAVPFDAVPKALQAAGNLSGKTLLDATNPLLPDLSGLDMPEGISAAEQIASLVPGVPVVKIFNTTGYPNMANPDYNGQRATMFYCGDNAAAKKIAAGLAEDLGFEPVDAGPLREARYLEPLAMLWIHLALKQGLGVNIAFKLMRR
jgi:predicted dinucleotide-binding enzyme